MHPRFFQIGSVAIPTSGVFTAAAIVAALITARFTARRLSLDGEKVWNLGIAAVLAALVAPRLVLIATHWSDFRAHPFWMIGLVTVRSPAAVAAGFALAVVFAVAFARLTGLPLRPVMDAFAPALAIGETIYWVGNSLSGAKFGTSTSLPWGVTNTSRLVSLWSGVPLGTPLHPVQLYMSLAELCSFLVCVRMIARRQPWNLRPGEVLGVWLFLHGFTSFFLSFLRGDLATALGAMILAQTVAFGMVLLSGVLLLWRGSARAEKQSAI